MEISLLLLVKGMVKIFLQGLLKHGLERCVFVNITWPWKNLGTFGKYNGNKHGQN